jgi:hypothetical protein
MLDSYNIFPDDAPDELKWWLLGVCCSKVTYIRQKKHGHYVVYPKFTSVSDKEFVEQVKSAFKVHTKTQRKKTKRPRLTKRRRRLKTQWCFNFPQGQRDFRSFFAQIGIRPIKENRYFPVESGGEVRHFMRGYIEAQSSAFIPKRPLAEVSIHFASVELGMQCSNILFEFGLGQMTTGGELTKPFSLYKVAGRKSWEMKIRGRMISGLCNLLYAFDYRITFRKSAFLEFQRVLGNWSPDAEGEPSLPDPDGSQYL